MQKHEMMDKIIQYQMRQITTSQVAKALDDYTAALLQPLVSGSCSVDELELIKRLAHEGLPDDCVKDWGEVKFCENRQGDGNRCKHCSHYR